MTRAASAIGAVLLTLLAPVHASAAGPQLFKCMDGSRTVYQQQACAVTSQVEVAASGSRASSKAASEPIAKVARIKPASSTASSALATPR